MARAPAKKYPKTGRKSTYARSGSTSDYKRRGVSAGRGGTKRYGKRITGGGGYSKRRVVVKKKTTAPKKLWRPGFDRTSGDFKLFGPSKKGTVQCETKYIDKNLTFAGIATATTSKPFNAIWTPNGQVLVAPRMMATDNWWICQNLLTNQQGTGGNQRIGKEIKLKKLLFNLGLTFTSVLEGDADPSKSYGVSFVLKILIIQDKQCNGSAVTSNELFENYTAVYPPTVILGQNNSNCTTSVQPNVSNSKRFVTLYETEKVMTLKANFSDILSNCSFTKMFTKKLDLNNMIINNSSVGTDASITGLRSNNILFCLGLANFKSITTTIDDEIAGPQTKNGTWNCLSFGTSRVEYIDC